MFEHRQMVMAGLALLMSSSALPALAQAVGAQPAGLEEIVVTARKVTENIETVPLSITAVSGAQLQREGVTQLSSLSATVPNFSFSETVANNDQISIRGIGSGVNAGFENSVGIVLDGVFFGRSRFGRAAFLDLQQAEVLRGPQGALIGKNTTAGAINIQSAKPTDSLTGYALATGEVVGDTGGRFEGAVGGPLTDRFKGRVAFSYDDQNGYFSNPIANRSEMQTRDYTVRATGEYDFAPSGTATLMYQHGQQDRVGRDRTLTACAANVQAALLAYGASCQETGLVTFSNNEQNGVPVPDTTNTGFDIAAFNVSYDTHAFGTLTSVLGYGGYAGRDQWDGDLTPIEAVGFLNTQNYQQVSEELRLSAVHNKTFDYIAGIYLMNAHLTNLAATDYDQQGPAPLFPVLAAAARARDNNTNDQTENTAAAFGQLTWHVVTTVDVTAGVRFTHDQKSDHNREFTTALYTETVIPVPAAGPAASNHDFHGSITENQATPDISVQWFAQPHTMFYAKYGQGYKGGGFNQSITGGASVYNQFFYQPEHVDAFEAGAKLRLLDNTLQLNADVFYSRFKNLQVSSVIPDPVSVIFNVGNAATAITQGVEADFRWEPVNRLIFSGNAAYLDAHFDSYTKAPCYTAQTVAQGCVGTIQNSSGKMLPFAPKWKVDLQGQYTWLLPSDFKLTAAGEVESVDSYYLTYSLDPLGLQTAYVKLNARATLTLPGSRWDLSLVGRNLTNQLTSDFGNTTSLASSFFRFIEPPREIMLQVRYSY